MLNANRASVRLWSIALCVIACVSGARGSCGQSPSAITATYASGAYETANFRIAGGSNELNKAVAEAAEAYRTIHWLEWFGHKPPRNWQKKCRVTLKVNAPAAGAGGATAFFHLNGTADDFTGTWQGPPNRLLDSVTPHEVMHTVIASEFGEPLPRWIDEGICMTLEHPEELKTWRRTLPNCLNAKRGIPTSTLIGLLDYPRDFEAFYGQSFSMVEYLISECGGRQKMIEFVREGLKADWVKALDGVYGLKPIDLQNNWLAWLGSTGGGDKHVVYQIPCSYPCGDGSCIQAPFYPMVARPVIRQPPPVIHDNPPPAPIPDAPCVSCDCGDKWTAILIRIEKLEQREGEPGPAGEKGERGKSGAAGKDAVFDPSMVPPIHVIHKNLAGQIVSEKDVPPGGTLTLRYGSGEPINARP